MQFNPPRFYRPYDDAKDEEASRARSDSSMTSSTQQTSDTEDSTVTATTGSTYSSGKMRIVGMDTGDTIDPRYELIRAAGPPINDTKKQYELQYNYGDSLNYAQYPPPELPPFPKDSPSLLQKTPTNRQVADLFSINSQNRDNLQYPYASYFTLQLPRTYKNVSAFNIVQISFPTLSGVIPDNTSALNLEILREIIPAFFDISSNEIINYCEAVETNPIDIISLIIDNDPSINLTSLLKEPYNLCLAEATAGCALGVASCLDSIFISEEGRFNPVNTSEILKLVYTIEPGRYISESIVDILNQSMNSTMYFDLISFNEYKAKIQGGEGAIVGFPYPLQYFYNNLTGRYLTLDEPVTGRSTLAAFYYPSIDTIFSLPPTNQEIFVSYYYPVLKEACINQNLRYLLDYSGYDVNQVYNDVVTGFFGLNYPLYVGMCEANVEFLDKVRRYYTQEYYTVNQYTWYYNNIKNRIGVTFNTLNRSIRTTVSTNYQENFSQALSFYETDIDNYNDAKLDLTSTTTGLPVLEQMATNFSEKMGILGVQVVDYTFDDISSNLTLFNTENTTTLVPGFNIFQEKAGTIEQTSYTNSPNPYFSQWPNLINLSQNYRFFQDLSSILSGSLLNVDPNRPYSVEAEQFLPQNLSGSQRYYGIDPTTSDVFITNGTNTDLFVNVGRTQYVIIPFRTPNKQNVQISTLSRPYVYRYPAYNLSQGGSSSGYTFLPGIGQYGFQGSAPNSDITQMTFGYNIGGTLGPYDYFNYFDETTETKYNTINMTNYNYLYNISFYSTLSSALASSAFSSNFQLNFLQPFNYFRLTPPIQGTFDTITNPYPEIYWDAPFDSVYTSFAPTISQVSSRYKARLTIVPYGSSTFNVGIVVTVYNDYTLFTADLNRGIENLDVNYLHKFEVAAGDTSGNLDFVMYSHIMDANNAQANKYYYIKVSQKEEVQNVQSYQLALWNETENIKVYQGFITPEPFVVQQKNFNEYTWSEVYKGALNNGIMSYWHACVLDPDFNAAGYVNGLSPLSYQFNNKIPMTTPFIGHDISGVSTDLTDYRGIYTDASGFNPNAEYYADPVSGYYFKLLTDYSDITHTYLFNGSQNAVYDASYQLYSFSGKLPTTLKREFKLTHWWDTHYIGPQTYQYYSTTLGAFTPDYNILSGSNIQVYEQASVDSSPILYGYGYYDYALLGLPEFTPFFGKQITLFDYNNATVPVNPPNYEETRNVLGFSYTLPDGIYKMKQLTFKTALFGAESNDPNSEIEKLFIFNAGSINLQAPTTPFQGGLKTITGTYNVPTTTFAKDLTNETNIIVNCNDADFAAYPGTTIFQINISEPFEGQNFIISNYSSLPITCTFVGELFFAQGTSPAVPQIPANFSGIPTILGIFTYYFIYKYGRWNFYFINDTTKSVNTFDYKTPPIAILNKTSRISYGSGGNAVNPNADKNNGTYYTFEIDEAYSNPDFIGSSLPTAEIQTNTYGSYVFVAVKTINLNFDIFGIGSTTPVFCFSNTALALVAGSLIPNPDAGVAAGDTTNPVSPWPSTNGNIDSPYLGLVNEQSMIIPRQTSVPSYLTGNFYQSQYGQSMPIITSGILIGTITPIITIGFNDIYNISFQSFWPVQNIIFERVATTYKPMAELNTIVNPELLNTNGEPIVDSSGAFECPRSQLFYYNNLDELFADISDATDGYRWGFETRYKAASTNFNGYKNNAYIFDITPETDSVGYLLLRAYSPAEQYQTLLRFTIKDTSRQAPTPGLYTFGLKTTDMLVSEFLDLSAGATNFSPDYANALREFYNSYIGNFVYGVRNFSFQGFNIDTFDTNYFLDQFRQLWINLQPAITLIKNVDEYAIDKTNDFIGNKYRTVLPSNLLTYSALTGDTSLPVTFYGDILGIQNSNPFTDLSNCTVGGVCQGIVNASQNSFACFPSGATIPTLEVQVGFPFQTITAVASLEGDTNNVINQNLYMQINTEQTFNNMNVALEETVLSRPINLCPPNTLSGVPSSNRTQNSVITRLLRQNYSSKEFRGSSKIANGKIILNNSVDNVTQTYLQAPTTFSPPLGKLDSLTFRVLTNELYPVYQVYPYITPELEWNAVISITEDINNIPAEEITQVARINVDPNKLPF